MEGGKRGKKITSSSIIGPKQEDFMEMSSMVTKHTPHVGLCASTTLPPQWRAAFGRLRAGPAEQKGLDALEARVREEPQWPAVLWCVEAVPMASWRRPLEDPCAVMAEARLPPEVLLSREVATAALDGALRQRLAAGGHTAERCCRAAILAAVRGAFRGALCSEALLDRFEALCVEAWPRAVFIVRPPGDGGGACYAALRSEARGELRLLAALRRRVDFVAPPHVQDDCEDLTGEQRQVLRQALRHLTCHGWACLLGPGGTGKTRVVRELVSAFRLAPATADLRVAALAPTNRAASLLAELLQDVEGVSCATLHSFWRSSSSSSSGSASEGLGLVVVDEASMLCAEHARLLADVLGRAGLLLVGDEVQLTPVGPGELLRPLVRQLRPGPEAFTLTRNMRARSGALAEDLLALRSGDASSLDARCEISDNFDRVAAWHPDLVLALHHEDRRAYNAHQAGGGLCREAGITAEAPASFSVGTPVRFRTNVYKPAAFRGSLGTVSSLASQSLFVRVQGRHVEVLRPDEELAAAHAITVHDAQGLQAGRVAVLFPACASPLLTLEMAYTAASRAEEDFRFFFKAGLPWEEAKSLLLATQPLRCTALSLSLGIVLDDGDDDQSNVGNDGRGRRRAPRGGLKRRRSPKPRQLPPPPPPASTTAAVGKGEA